MGQQNNSRELRKKRARVQQYTISVCCLALMIFIMIWIVNVALTGRKIQTGDFSSSQSSLSEQADIKDSSVKRTIQSSRISLIIPTVRQNPQKAPQNPRKVPLSRRKAMLLHQKRK